MNSILSSALALPIWLRVFFVIAFLIILFRSLPLILSMLRLTLTTEGRTTSRVHRDGTAESRVSTSPALTLTQCVTCPHSATLNSIDLSDLAECSEQYRNTVFTVLAARYPIANG